MMREAEVKFVRYVLAAVITASMLVPAVILSQVPPPIAGAVQEAQVDINSATGPELEPAEHRREVRAEDHYGPPVQAKG
jgi:hypothetical protein